MPRNFFGGHKVDDNRVRRLPADTFPLLVERFFDAAVPLSITRQAYLDLPKSQRDEIKKVAYVTAVSFKEPFLRRLEHADTLQLAFLDFDDGEEPKRMLECPQAVARQLEPFSFVLYTTANHRPEAPRLRLMVDLEPMPVSRHPEVIDYIASLLGMPEEWKGITESKVTVQAMYRPVVFQGEQESPILISRTSGVPLAESDLPERPEKTADKSYAAECDAEEGLDHLPVPDAAPSLCAAALDHLDPDADYFTWTNMAMALRHQFRSEEQAREAFDIFDAWSAKGAKYPGRENIYRKWCSFRPVPKGRDPVTIRSLFKAAAEAGWDASPITRQTLSTFETWLDGIKDPAKLQQDFVAKIAATPLRTEVTDETLLDLVAKRYNKLASARVPVSVFRRQLKKSTQEKTPEDPDDKPRWLRPFVYVASANEFCHTTTMDKFTPASFDKIYSRHLMPPDISEGGNAKPYALPSDYACNVKKLPTASTYIYDPRYGGTEPIFEDPKNPGRFYMNTYRPSYPDPDPATSGEAERIIRKHLSIMIAEEEYQVRWLDFLAFLPQYPGVKIRWSPVIQSTKRAGKGLIGEAMKGVLGADNVKPVSNAILAKSWNDWAKGAQLLILEEIHVSGQNRRAVMNSLKEFFTNDVIPIDEKYEKFSVIDNIANAICFTNEVDALAIDVNEGRYFVVKSPLQRKAQVDALEKSGWYAQVLRLRSELAGGLRHFLLNYRISDSFNPNGSAPVTCYQKEMAEDTKSNVIAMIEEMILADEHPLVCHEVISAAAISDRLGRRPDSIRPGRFLREMGYEHAGSHRVNGSVMSLWTSSQHYDADLMGSPVEFLEERVKRMEVPL